MRVERCTLLSQRSKWMGYSALLVGTWANSMLYMLQIVQVGTTVQLSRSACRFVFRRHSNTLRHSRRTAWRSRLPSLCLCLLTRCVARTTVSASIWCDWSGTISLSYDPSYYVRPVHGHPLGRVLFFYDNVRCLTINAGDSPFLLIQHWTIPAYLVFSSVSAFIVQCFLSWRFWSLCVLSNMCKI